MTKNKIISALRLCWLRSPTRYLAIKSARVKRGRYRCNHCNKLFALKQVQVDHIVEIGSFADWNSYIEKLFCSIDNLQVLCKPCHKKKTLLKSSI
jgi:5-methylcytosine-specific restriction endonuclease McrA